MNTTDQQDLYGFVALENGCLLGAIFFSRLTFESGVESFILSPVAVHSDHQRTGIGQGLINHGLQQLRNAGVDLVITYGDPDYYIKVGFKPLSQEVIQPPHELSQPIGWIGQSLQGSSADYAAQGACRCVHALDDKSYW
jgi:predicted N-acetyltransferase YhbS